MKKTLVALAALATVGAAFAQSTVTLYGKIDFEVVSKRANAAGAASVNPGLQVNSAGLSGSRWGMKGSEDLGGGLSAIFDLQGGFTVDNGGTAQCGGGSVVNAAACGLAGPNGTNPASRIFGRQAYAGLKGGFGQVSAGRQYGPYDNAFGVVDGQGYTSNSAMGAVWNGYAAPGQTAVAHADGSAGGTGRIDNQLTYFTPALGGFNAQVSWAPGENKTPVLRASSIASVGLGYGNGPINVQYAFESQRPQVGPSMTGWILGGSYDLGVARPYIAYGRGDFGTKEDRKWSLGVSAPVGPVTLSAGYAKTSTTAAPGAASSDTHGFGGQAVYALSKRTNVYTEFLSASTRAAGAAVRGKASQFGVGMRHDF